jgi:hypothetical protein
MPSEVLLTQGTTIQVSTTAATEVNPSVEPSFATLACITREIQFQEGSATENDVTTLCSTAKEFRLGLQDPGTMTLSGHWKQGNAGHTVLRTAAADKEARLFKVTFEDGSIFRALGYVQQRSWSAPTDGVVSATYNIRLTGATNEDDPSGA